MSVKKGTTSIGKVYVGNKEIDRIYKGSTLVYQNILLPREYQQVEYIESTGTQYIDTGIKGNLSTKIEFGFEMTSSSVQYLFGSCLTYNTDVISLSRNTLAGNYYRVFFGNPASANGNYSLGFSKKTLVNKCYIDNSKVTLDEEIYNYNYSSGSSFETPYTITIFARNNNGTVDYFASVKIKYFKIYDNDTLVRNYIPCYRKIDGVAGLYDLVNGVFYTNAGTEEFICGHPILSNDYDLLEHIESTGTQYINSGTKTSNTIKVECKAINTFGLTAAGTTYGGGLIGARKSSSNSNFSLTTGVSYDYVGNGSSSLSITRNENTNIIYLTYSNNAISYVCGTFSYINNNLDIQITNQFNIYIFAMNQDDSAIQLGTYKLYSCRIYDNNEIVRDFVPAVRLADNTIGLYDIKNDVFYANAGSGTFVAGPYVFFPHALQEVEYIETTQTGTYIDSGINGTSTTFYEITFSQDTKITGTPCGAYAGVSNARLYCFTTAGTNIIVANGVENIVDVGYQENKKFNLKYLTRNQIIVNGITYSLTESSNTFNVGRNFQIFSRGYSTPQDFIGKIYMCKIYNNSSLVRDFVPCYRKSDNVIGMFDKVTGTFYTNAGTGTFTKGDNV